MVARDLVAKALTGFWLLAVAGLLHLVSAETLARARLEHQLLTPVPLSQLNPRLVNILTLGYHAIYDDFIAMWLVQILVDPQVIDASPQDLFKLVKAATHHLPKLESVYMLPCFVLAFDLKHPEYCEPLIQDGIEGIPASWRLPATAGYIAAFKLRDPGRAAFYYELASNRPLAPSYLHGFAVKLAAKDELTGEERDKAIQELVNTPGGDGPQLPGMRKNFKKWGGGP